LQRAEAAPLAPKEHVHEQGGHGGERALRGQRGLPAHPLIIPQTIAPSNDGPFGGLWRPFGGPGRPFAAAIWRAAARWRITWVEQAGLRLRPAGRGGRDHGG